MTPDEAATILGVDKNAEVSEILATYSKKVQAAGADTTQPGNQDPEVQALVEARTTLMDDRRRRAATEHRPSTSATSTPQYGQRSATAAPTVSAWGDDAAKGKRYTPEQEATRKQRSFIIAIIGLILSLTGWVWWLLTPLSLFGMGISIWALVRVRGYGSGLYTGTRIVAWISIISGALALIGNILLIVNALAAGK
ncbi:hypothetical protein [Humibacter sp. RRB41]|uniref:hypothetical protein n=1 Tax=Humibacter sp. RRB41 TaxID=2919946 RepID=UPI001FA98E86|nr:hypothetical protein [Humibacter sp. RRB41]